jgi:hypothetical protein
MTAPKKCPRCGVSFGLRSERLHDRYECDQALRNRAASAPAATAAQSAPIVRPSVTHNGRDAQKERDAQQRDAQPARSPAASPARATRAMTPAERQARRRAKDPEGWRQRHRDYMRRRRAAARAS